MKTQTNSGIFTSMSKTQVTNLTTVVDETLAMNLATQHCKTFSAADLWNIQRHGRNRTQRRYSL
jgi:hypothetical protein